ncbi:hypothetical protein NZK32_07330 [Cyanobium sp. FGCU-52]|nr:hypothetical protein [Cyanobium sp. FGCU52]
MTLPCSRTHRRIPTLLAAGIGVVAAAIPVGAAAVNLPQAGVICDTGTRICYTGDGPSLSQTRREYGSRAEQDLLRRLSGRPPAQEFTLSSGELCDLRQRTCWDDGNRRRNVSNRLTQQLWGGTGTGNRTCQLSQRGRRLFDGSCRLTRRNDFNGTAYQVETSDGRRYDFTYARDGRLVLRDATGTWPVTTSNWGNRVQFRWADLQLETSRRSGDRGYGSAGGSGGLGSGDDGGYGQGYGPGDRGAPVPIPVSPGQALDTILNGLFK